MNKRFGMLAALAALAAIGFLANPVVAHAVEFDAGDFNQLNCGWPLSLSPEGPANIQAPDDAARYYIMPFDTTRYRSMTLRGTYPRLRYFSIAAYEVVDKDPGYTFEVSEDLRLYDAQIVPDQGVNPFVQPGGGGGAYSVEIVRQGAGSSAVLTDVSRNTITVTADLVWIVLRAYVSDADASLTGQSLMGGVPLPTITAIDHDGASEPLETCSPINRWSDLVALGRHLFPPEFDMVVDEGTPSSDRLWFASPQSPPPNLWPNPDGKYLMMLPGRAYQPGRIIVIRGKAPGFPDTFNGSTIWDPAPGFRSVDMRYWAMCNLNLSSPISVVACATDLTTKLQAQAYTIVISDDRLRPDWLRPNVNWLPWGDIQYPKAVVLRNMLPSPEFPHAAVNVWASENPKCTFGFAFPPDPAALDAVGPCAEDIMGDYYPVALWCDKDTFRAGGFEACLRESD